mgnify:CR=1 FL=1
MAVGLRFLWKMKNSDKIAIFLSYICCVIAAYYTATYFDLPLWSIVIISFVLEFIVVFWCTMFCYSRPKEATQIKLASIKPIIV